MGITAIEFSFFGIYFNVLNFLVASVVAELSEKKKRLHFCLRFTLQ